MVSPEQLGVNEAPLVAHTAKVGDVRFQTRTILSTTLQATEATGSDSGRAEFDAIGPGDIANACTVEPTELRQHLFNPEKLNPTLAVSQNLLRQYVLRKRFTQKLQAVDTLTPGEKKNHDRIESDKPEAARTFRLKNQLAHLRRLAFGSEPNRDVQRACVAKWTGTQLTQLFFEFRERASSFSDPKETLAWDDMVLLYELSDEGRHKMFRENSYVREYLLFALLRSSDPTKNEKTIEIADELIKTHASGMPFAAKGDALRNLGKNGEAKAAYREGFERHHSHYPGLNLLLFQIAEKAPADETDALCRSIGVSLRLEGGADSKEFWTHAGMLEVACLQNRETDFGPILQKMDETTREDFADWKVTLTKDRLEKAKNFLESTDPRVSRLTVAIQGLEEICRKIADAKGKREGLEPKAREIGSELPEFHRQTWNFRSLLHPVPVQIHYKGMEKELPDYTMTLTDRKLLTELLQLWQIDGIDDSEEFIDGAIEKISELLGTNVPGRRGKESIEQVQELRRRVALLCGVVPGKTLGTLTSASVPVLLEIGGAAAHAQLLQALFDLWQRGRTEAKLKQGDSGLTEAENILSQELRTAVVDIYQPIRAQDLFDALEQAGEQPVGEGLKINYQKEGQEYFALVNKIRSRTDGTFTLSLVGAGEQVLDPRNGDVIRLCTNEKQMRTFLVGSYFGSERVRIAGSSSSQTSGQHFGEAAGLGLKQHGTHLTGQPDDASDTIFDFHDAPAEFTFRKDAGGEKRDLRIGGLHLAAPEQTLKEHLQTRRARLTKRQGEYPPEHEEKLEQARESLDTSIAELSEAIASGMRGAQEDAGAKAHAAGVRYQEVSEETFSPNYDAPTPLLQKLGASPIESEHHLLGASVRGGLSLIGARNLLGADLQTVRDTAREIAANVRTIAGKEDTQAIAEINVLREESGVQPLDPIKAPKLLKALRETLEGITKGNIGHTSAETYLPMSIRDLDSILPVIDMEVKLALSRELHANAMKCENEKRVLSGHPPLSSFEEYLDWLMAKENTIGKPPPPPVLQETANYTIDLGSDAVGVERLRTVTQEFSKRAEEGQANQPFTLDAVRDILGPGLPQSDHPKAVEKQNTEPDDIDRIAILTTSQTLLNIQGKDVELPAADRWKILEFSAHFLAAYRLAPSAQSLKLQDLVVLLHDNAVKLAHQNAADFMTLVGSNHGVLHLLRSNGEMLLSIFRQLDHFTPERQALALQALFDHDMGYTKAGLQSGNASRNLFQNSKDHPLESALLVEAREAHYRRYFGDEGFRTIRNAVLDHSDALGKGQFVDGRFKPEILTDSMASTEALVVSGLSLVDCLGTTGDVKLSSTFREFPQILGFMAQIQEIWDEFRENNPGAKQLTGDSKTDVQEILDDAAALVDTAADSGKITPGTARRISQAIRYAMDLSESDFAIGLNFQMLGAHVSTALDFDENIPEVTYFIDQAGQEAIMQNLLEKRTKMSKEERIEALVRIGMKAIKKAADDFGGFSSDTSAKVAEFIRNVNNLSDTTDSKLSAAAEQYFHTSDVTETASFRRDGMRLEVRTEGGIGIVIAIGTKKGNQRIAEIIEKTNRVTKARRKTVALLKGMIENDAILIENGHLKSTSGLALSSKEAYAYIMNTLTSSAAEAFDVTNVGGVQTTLLARLEELFGSESAFWPSDNTEHAVAARREVLTVLIGEFENARLRPIRGIHGKGTN